MKPNRLFCSHYAMKIVADMRSITSSCPRSEYNSSHCITTVAIMSSNYITARDLLETADRCRTTSSIEFHQTLSFPSSVGEGSGYARLANVTCFCMVSCFVVIYFFYELYSC